MTKNLIPGTLTRVGNIAIVAASQAAPISFVDLNSMFAAASMPLLAKRRYLSLSKAYVWPAVEDAYYRQKSDLVRFVQDPVNVAMDGNYDSPGFSAELCAVAAIEEETHQVLDFTTVHKSEVENVSGRMELEGVKKLLPSIESHVMIGDITIDKHPQVCAFLRNQGYQYRFDPWHRLRSVKKELRNLVKGTKDADEKGMMKELFQRFIIHVYSSIERANGDADLCKELVISFFLHVQGGIIFVKGEGREAPFPLRSRRSHFQSLPCQPMDYFCLKNFFKESINGARQNFPTLSLLVQERWFQNVSRMGNLLPSCNVHTLRRTTIRDMLLSIRIQ